MASRFERRFKAGPTVTSWRCFWAAGTSLMAQQKRDSPQRNEKDGRKVYCMPIRLVDKSVKTPRAATRNLLSGNQETRYSFDSWLLGLLIKTGRQGLVGFAKQPDKPASNFVSSR